MINIKIIYFYNIYYLVMSDNTAVTNEIMTQDEPRPAWDTDNRTPSQKVLDDAHSTYLEFLKGNDSIPSDADETKTFMAAFNNSSPDDQAYLLNTKMKNIPLGTPQPQKISYRNDKHANDVNPLIRDFINKNKSIFSRFPRLFSNGGKTRKTKKSKKSKTSKKSNTSKKTKKSRKSKK